MADSEPLSLTIPATTQSLAEAEALSEDILKDIELSQRPLSVVALKALRLARLLNDFELHQVFEWESSGYPRGVSGVSPEVWAAGERAGRVFFGEDSTPEVPKPLMYTASIEQLEHTVATGEFSIQAAQDPSISISRKSHQAVQMPQGNAVERTTIRRQMLEASEQLAARRTLRRTRTTNLSLLALRTVFGRIRSAGLPVVPEAAYGSL